MYGKVEESVKEESYVRAQGMCLTLCGLQIIFDVIVNDFEYFDINYPGVTKLIKAYSLFLL